MISITEESSRETTDKLGEVSSIPKNTYFQYKNQYFNLFTNEKIEEILAILSGNQVIVEETLNELLPKDSNALEFNLKLIKEAVEVFNRDVETIKSKDATFNIETIDLDDNKNNVARAYNELSDYLSVQINPNSEEADAFSVLYSETARKNTANFEGSKKQANKMSDEEFIDRYVDGITEPGVRPVEEFTENDKIYQTIFFAGGAFHSIEVAPYTFFFKGKDLVDANVTYKDIEKVNALDIDVEEAKPKEVTVPELPIWPGELVKPVPVTNVELTFTQVKFPEKPEEPLLGEALTSIEEVSEPKEAEKIDNFEDSLDKPIDVIDVNDPVDFTESIIEMPKDVELPVEPDKPEIVPPLGDFDAPSGSLDESKEVTKPGDVTVPEKVDLPDLELKDPTIITKPGEIALIEPIEKPILPNEIGEIEGVKEPEKPVKPTDPTDPVDQAEPTNPTDSKQPKEVSAGKRTNSSQGNMVLPKTGQASGFIASMTGLLAMVSGLWVFRKKH